MVYFRDGGYLNRIFLTQQGGKLVAESGSSDVRFLPDVLEDGKAWQTDTTAFHVGGGGGDQGFQIFHRHVVAVERETVKTPAGTFRDCVRVDTFSRQPEGGSKGEDISFFYSDWYAPGVGLVRTEQYDAPDRKRERTRIELLSYDVKPADGGE
jgi:hypothetical protein